MKIAITADVHLTLKEKHPERFQTFQCFLDDVLKQKIQTVILAGDCFDAESPNYSEFESLVSNPPYQSLQFIVFPGNHDESLSQSMFSAANIRIVQESGVERFDLMSLPVLFIPYKKNQTMGEVIAEHTADLPENKWILIGHGDWIEGMREINPFEPGVYMPLSRVDVDMYRPIKAILGHIHKPLDYTAVHYPGSPCPLDINETGKRRYLILDTENGQVVPQALMSERIYFNETIVLYPVPNEIEYLKDQIQQRLDAWHLTANEKEKTQIRIQIKGYTTNKPLVQQVLDNMLDGYQFYKNEGADLSRLFFTEDTERAEIADRVAGEIQNMIWPENEDEPSKNEILLQALHAVYGD